MDTLLKMKKHRGGVPTTIKYKIGALKGAFGVPYAAGSYLEPVNTKEKIAIAKDLACPMENQPFSLAYYGNSIKKALDIKGSFQWIGSGSYGQVYKVTSPVESDDEAEEGVAVAVKIMSSKFANKKHALNWKRCIRQEMYYLNKLQHPHIVHFYGHVFLKDDINCTDSSALDYHCALKTELLAGGDLDQIMRKRRSTLAGTVYGTLTLPEIANLGAQIQSAMVYMHGKRIVHHDLKPSNVMAVSMVDGPDGDLSQLEYKIIDFGMAKRYRQTQYKAVEYKFAGGTQFYMSKEKAAVFKFGRLAEKKSLRYQPFLADNYAFGVTLLEVLFGYEPVSDEFKKCFNMSKVASQLISDRLTKEDSDRYENILENIQMMVCEESQRLQIDDPSFCWDI